MDEARQEIDIVITDMVMPEMGGRMMAEWLQAIRPELKVLFTSGYTECGMGGGVDPALEFIPKPYSPSGLLYKVREVLDKGGREEKDRFDGLRDQKDQKNEKAGRIGV